MSRCRCSDIRRANNELAQITTGISRLSNAQSGANRKQNLLSAVADAVYSGAFAVTGSSNASAIEALVNPVNISVEQAQSDFANAQTTITNRLNAMQTEDRAFHRLQAERAAQANGN